MNLNQNDSQPVVIEVTRSFQGLVINTSFPAEYRLTHLIPRQILKGTYTLTRMIVQLPLIQGQMTHEKRTWLVFKDSKNEMKCIGASEETWRQHCIKE